MLRAWVCPSVDLFSEVRYMITLWSFLIHWSIASLPFGAALSIPGAWYLLSGIFGASALQGTLSYVLYGVSS